MKSFVIFFFFILFIMESNAQTFTNEQAKAIFNQLAKEKIIAQSFKNQIVTLIDEKNWDKLHYIQAINSIPEEELTEILIMGEPDSSKPFFTKNNILRICLDDYRKKREKTQGGWVVYPPLSVSPEILNDQIVTQKKPAKKTKFLKLLNVLKSTQLIDNQGYNDALYTSHTTVSEVIGYVIERNIFYDYYPIIKQQQLKVLADLQKNDIISEANYQKYINSYQNYELHNWVDILADCRNAILLSDKELYQKPFDYYALLFQKVKEILPEFDFKDLRIVEKANYISVKIQGIEYQQHIKVNKKIFPQLPINHLLISNMEPQLELVNDFLRDNNKPYRFYWINQSNPYSSSPNFSENTGFILLDSLQKQLFEPMLSYESFNERRVFLYNTNFKRENLKNKIKNYISQNITPQLLDNEIDSVIVEIIRDKPKHLFNHLPFSKFKPNFFESESTQINLSLSIQKELNEIANITQNVVQIKDFKLEKLSVPLDPIDSADLIEYEQHFESYHLKIDYSNKIYEVKGWANDILNELPNLMNQMMENNHIKAKFVELDFGEWLYLNEKQLDYFRQNEPEIFEKLKE